ncbi:5-methylthioadenosine/S-adenosylhomocysteine deaminase MtaD [Gottschalkia purinilytica]|uniref:5-methylthioadenosine/S-adenosylhomocysteine deaminase n=1 Tax=Gottschalkia purinilytica TaxID=1503 RepID=A0A0L0WCK8_GOTPU|nr:amidohydrolase [Gottschalkia purinilytica]KNF09196.1 5-methylthioadenosine/S-adenosylhomocysteine deaminase MtaD [Gottschalkia purinilytica]
MKILIKNCTALLMNGNDEIIENISIGIEGDKIKYIGKIPNDFNADKTIDATNKLVMPGLINAHTHIPMSLFRNYADDIPFWEWLTERIWPLEKRLTGEHVYWGSMLSIAEMIMSGITSFSDMYFLTDGIPRAVEETGVRGVLSKGLVGKDEDDNREFEEIREFIKIWNEKADGRITTRIAPHAPYSCLPGYMRRAIELAKEYNLGIHVHLSESKKEIEDSYKAFGKSPIQHVNDIGLFELPTLAAHCVYVSDEDIKILAEKNVCVVNNPGSNLKLGNGFAPVDKMLKSGVNLALGTDGSASNNNLNMFEEINLAALINKGINTDPTSVPASTAIKMATINGAKGIGLESEIGSIEINKKADIILIDLNKPHLYPRYNLMSSLAYSVQASDVDTVIVDGKILMENRELKTIDIEKVIYNSEKMAKDLIER